MAFFETVFIFYLYLFWVGYFQVPKTGRVCPHCRLSMADARSAQLNASTHMERGDLSAPAAKHRKLDWKYMPECN